MMKGHLIRYDGQRLDLPPFTGWKLTRTGTVPCDSFEGECPWDGGSDKALSGACRLVVEEDGQRRFTGVLDEYELAWDGAGGRLSVAGRGMAALLLDNEARGQDYQLATLKDILRDHVSPYGVEIGELGRARAVSGFSVETGSSEWKVLYDFARYHAALEPRFDVYGRLSVTDRTAGRQLRVDDTAGPISVVWRDRRYGVCSEILVQDRGSLAPQRVADQAFLDEGGRCRRVVTMPGKSTYQAMRWSGQFQLERSREERFRVELTFPGSYFCEPGDQVEVSLTTPGLWGTWRALESEAVLDGTGTRVKVTLG